MTEHTRIGVVGAGVMGRRHARAIAEHPSLDLVGVADIDEAAAREVADRNGSDAFGAFEPLYEKSLDAVVVATPETAHREPTVAAVDRGYNVLLEKPVAQDRENAAAIRDAVERADISVLVGFTLRFDARYGAVISAVDDGDLGDLASIRGERSVVTSEARRMRRSHPLLYQTIHDVDVARRLTGSEVETVYSVGSQRVFDGDPHDVIFSTLSFADGTVACIETGSILPEGSPAPNRARLSVKGTDGTAELAVPGDDLELSTDRASYPDDTVFPVVNSKQEGAVRGEIDHFARVIRGRESPVATLDDGLRAGAIARACRRAIDAEGPVPVEPIPGGDDR
jgi:predicted dehydrogenase